MPDIELKSYEERTETIYLKITVPMTHPNRTAGVIAEKLDEAKAAGALLTYCSFVPEKPLPQEIGYVLVNLAHAEGPGYYYLPADSIYPTAEDAAFGRNHATEEHGNPAIHMFKVVPFSDDERDALYALESSQTRSEEE